MGVLHYQTAIKRSFGEAAAFAGSVSRKPSGSAPGNIFLLQAEDHTDHLACYFIQVSPLRLPQFRKAVQSGNTLDLEIYGEVIASGYGQPSDEVRNDIRSRFGWNG